LLSFGAVSAVSADEYPTWDDVRAAQKNESSKRTEIARIESIVAELENEAAALARDSLEKAELYNQARDALDAATARTETLESQADAAQSVARESTVRAGQLVAQLARSGGGDITLALLLSGNGADTMLYKLEAMGKLAEQSSLIYERAEADSNVADALTEQAAVSREARRDLAAEAQSALVSAQKAADDAEAKVAKQKAASSQLYAQLASLKGTTAATEQEYLDGLAWEAAQEAVTNPPPPAPPVNPPPAPPSTGAVAGAIAYARAQLGEPYQLGGAGPNVWDCSGLTKMSYASVGVYIGTHSASNQYTTMQNAGRLVQLSDLTAGDLLFYSNGGSASGSKYHVTMYIGGGQMIEAPRPGANVRIKPVRYGDLVPYAGRPTP
jgi:cell wall-associated NlpC family hydrolase/exonuclease VII small subunit